MLFLFGMRCRFFGGYYVLKPGRANRFDLYCAGTFAVVGTPTVRLTYSSGREKKRKRFSFSDNATKINRIKVALAEVIADTDPKDAKTSEILGHLTTAHAAIETASSLLPGNGQMHRTLTDPSGPRCHVTMLGRAAIFHQWQASRADLTCPTDEKSVK